MFTFPVGMMAVPGGDSDVGWNLATAVYDSIFKDVSAQEAFVTSVGFKDDGTKMYVMGDTSNTIHQYSLSTPWNVSTATYDSVSFSINTQEATAISLFIKPDGTKFYVVGAGSDSVHQYSMGTPWDLSTASYDSVSISVSAQDANPYGLYINEDGTKMYILGNTNDRVFQYTLSTPWVVSSATYDSVSFLFSGQDTVGHSVWFKTDGTRMYILGDTNNRVYQYNMSAWDLSTAVYNSVSFAFAPASQPFGLTFSPDGTKMYINDPIADDIFQYSLTN